MPSDQRTGRSSLPDQRTLLSWLFVGRLILAVGVLMGAGLVWTERPQESFLVSVSVVIALTFTAYGAWVVHLQRREPGNTFLLIQAIVDLGVVTTVVHFAGQPQSAFPSLYVLVVAAYALLMPPAWGVLTAFLASAAFLGDALLSRTVVLDASPTATPTTTTNIRQSPHRARAGPWNRVLPDTALRRTSSRSAHPRI